MNRVKVTMLLSALASMLVVAGASAESPQGDPIVGKWRWHGKMNHVVVHIDQDGILYVNGSFAGQWKLIDRKERRYLLRWGGGATEDKASLAQDGKKLKCRAPDGWRFTAERVEPF